ncbi:MAG: TlpA family protein disulfide reductase [Gammaproteobacteria bacterium]
MSVRLLRLVRYASILLICSLAGYYAGVFVFAPDNTVTITPQMLADAKTTVATPENDAAPDALPLTLPDIQLADLGGEMRSLSEWADGPLVINFWATWCAPCLREMPMLENVWQERQGDSLTIVGIAVDRIDAVTPYVEKTGVTYPILVGGSDAMEAAEAFGPDFAGLPYTVFVAGGGKVIGVFSGELERDRLEAMLEIVADATDGRIPIDAARARLREDAT